MQDSHPVCLQRHQQRLLPAPAVSCCLHPLLLKTQQPDMLLLLLLAQWLHQVQLLLAVRCWL
jgi:hypothetical protein